VLAALVGIAAAVPAAHAGELPIAVETRASTVSAFGGYVAWSHYDAASHAFSLLVRDPSGAVRTAAAGSRSVPFDVDLGPGVDGRPVAVYSRCERDPDPLPFMVEFYAAGRGCRIYRLALSAPGARPRRVPTGLPSSRSTVLPTIWRDRIAFAARPSPSAHGDARLRVAVYTRRGTGATRRLPGGPLGLVERGNGVAYGQGPTTLDLASGWLALAWQYLGEPPACRIPPGELAPNRNTYEVRLVHVVTRPTTRVLDRGCVDDAITGVASPSISGGRVHYLVGHATGDLRTLLRSRPLTGGSAADVLSDPASSQVVSYAQDGRAAIRMRETDQGYLVSIVGRAFATPGAALSASAEDCGFHPVDFHTVSARKGISCAEAKRVLLQLRGRRDTIPMICGRSRVLHGWRLENHGRLWSAVTNHYSRGGRSFVYQRVQNGSRVSCPPKGGSTS
jgi:hypothetical protein